MLQSPVFHKTLVKERKTLVASARVSVRNSFRSCHSSLQVYRKTWRADLNRFPQILLVGKNEG